MSKEPTLMCRMIFSSCDSPTTGQVDRDVSASLELEGTDQIERIDGVFRQKIGRPNGLVKVDSDLPSPTSDELLRELHEQAMAIMEDDYSLQQMILSFEPSLTSPVEAVYEMMRMEAVKAEVARLSRGQNDWRCTQSGRDWAVDRAGQGFHRPPKQAVRPVPSRRT